jgi:hypothetical protein
MGLEYEPSSAHLWQIARPPFSRNNCFGFTPVLKLVKVLKVLKGENLQERQTRSTVIRTYAQGQHVLQGVRGAVLALVVRQYDTSLSG